jgi:hypothetical protein
MRDSVVWCLIDFVVEEAEMTGGVLAEVRFTSAGNADDKPDFQGVALSCSMVISAA